MRTFQYIGYSPDAALNLHRDLRPRGAPVIPRREPVTEGVPKPGDLLIIPRLTLGTGKGDCELLLRTLERMRLDELVEQGVRVLVMEQSLDNLFGIQTENVRPRQAFIAAKGHPVFEGLTDGDLANWTGNSTLESAITAYSPTENRFPERLWHTSNANAVSTRTLVRPQVGAVRALAVSGFDLQESPLLEVVRGKGRYVFCQFDVSDRYGVDPAATRLFDNLLAYLASVPDGDPARGEVATVPPGRDGVEAKARVFRAAVPEGDAAWGITQGDLFFRESIYTRNDVTRALPAVTVPVWAKTDAFGYPQVVRTQAGTLATTLSPDLFETGWMKRKAAWVRAALVVNQGGSRSDGPALRHHGRVTDLYPHVWVEGFVHPYTSNIW
jgi:hypothetical protein